MTLDLDQLKRVALAATPGPWTPNLYGTYASVYACSFHICNINRGEHYTGKANEDADFISNWNPQTALALIERIEELCASIEGNRSELDRYKRAVEHAKESLPDAINYRIDAILEGK